MPQGDRTGPMGQGPRTGRAMGFCSGYDTPGYAKGFGGGMGRGFGFGRGMGRGHGYGRGWNMGSAFTGFFQGFPWMHTMSKDDEIAMLKSQAEAIKRSQKEIEKRLSELESEE
jgi:Family of unknown function (DUF5320)